jgi:hypothetical protein
MAESALNSMDDDSCGFVQHFCIAVYGIATADSADFLKLREGTVQQLTGKLHKATGQRSDPSIEFWLHELEGLSKKA